ncbi:MAG: hypothetical protein HOE69_07530 [Euryarchaeota archaeon]|jgi:hypothetical protein|nr:hypothetical protein [Euryarchaeota archaeon]
MSFELDEELLAILCKAVAGKKANNLQELFKSLVDEEYQVRHMIRPHRIIRRIDETIDNHLEEKK